MQPSSGSQTPPSSFADMVSICESAVKVLVSSPSSSPNQVRTSEVGAREEFIRIGERLQGLSGVKAATSGAITTQEDAIFFCNTAMQNLFMAQNSSTKKTQQEEEAAQAALFQRKLDEAFARVRSLEADLESARVFAVEMCRQKSRDTRDKVPDDLSLHEAIALCRGDPPAQHLSAITEEREETSASRVVLAPIPKKKSTTPCCGAIFG